MAYLVARLGQLGLSDEVWACVWRMLCIRLWLDAT